MPRQEGGAGSILAIMLIGVALLGLSGATLAANLEAARQRIQAQTDSIALAVEDARRGINTGYPCEVAAEFATSYMVNLDECRILGFSVHVKTHSETMGIVFSAEASAMP